MSKGSVGAGILAISEAQWLIRDLQSTGGHGRDVASAHRSLRKSAKDLKSEARKLPDNDNTHFYVSGVKRAATNCASSMSGKELAYNHPDIKKSLESLGRAISGFRNDKGLVGAIEFLRSLESGKVPVENVEGPLLKCKEYVFAFDAQRIQCAVDEIRGGVGELTSWSSCINGTKKHKPILTILTELDETILSSIDKIYKNVESLLESLEWEREPFLAKIAFKRINDVIGFVNKFGGDYSELCDDIKYKLYDQRWRVQSGECCQDDELRKINKSLDELRELMAQKRNQTAKTHS